LKAVVSWEKPSANKIVISFQDDSREIGLDADDMIQSPMMTFCCMSKDPDMALGRLRFHAEELRTNFSGLFDFETEDEISWLFLRLLWIRGMKMLKIWFLFSI